MPEAKRGARKVARSLPTKGGPGSELMPEIAKQCRRCQEIYGAMKMCKYIYIQWGEILKEQRSCVGINCSLTCGLDGSVALFWPATL